jgi:FtsP/CotA-like multicopper oxidase with cupredoxin domain
MHRAARKALVSLLVALLIVLPLGSSAPSTARAAALSTTVVYNLFATDGWINLADGGQGILAQYESTNAASAPLYIYGFVGGRAGQPYTYLQSADPAHPYAEQTTRTIAAGPPAPTGGPRVGEEINLAGQAQFPGPLIYAKVGDVVELRLKNLGTANPDAPNDPHTIHLHGLDVDAANDGVPETSVAAVPASLTDNEGRPWPGAGNVVVYMFSPTMPGTYFYHCHQEASIHVTMGMYGALVVYNPWDAAASTGPGTGKGGDLFGFHYDKDYVLLLSETDVRQHMAEEAAGPYAGEHALAYNPTDFHPQYWFINGLSFPNTIHADTVIPSGEDSTAMVVRWSNWIASHPGYDAFITGAIADPDRNIRGERVLLRMINMGFETHPMHMHGFHAKVIGSDQRAWPWANNPYTPLGQGMEKNTTNIGSGETYELLLDFNAWETVNSIYTEGTQSRYTTADSRPAYSTPTTNPAIPDPFLPGPPQGEYIGGPIVAGVEGNHANETSQYFPYHNHDDYKATNYGTYPGGMFTMIRLDPPLDESPAVVGWRLPFQVQIGK